MSLTDYRSLYDKDFIGAWDLTDGDLTVTIKKCIGGSLTAPGGRKSKKPVVYMTHTEKGFALNATNGKTIAALYGNHVEKWAGKQITLYKSMTRSPQGDGDVECIRVRPVVPRQQNAPAPVAATRDDPQLGPSLQVPASGAPSNGARQMPAMATSGESKGNAEVDRAKLSATSADQDASTLPASPYITDEQVIELDAKCSEWGINVDALKKAAGVERLSQIKAADHARALSWIAIAITKRKNAAEAT